MTHHLYEYAVIKQEKRDKDDQITEAATILVEPTRVLARSEQEAAIVANRQIGDEHMGDLDRVDVVVRPF